MRRLRLALIFCIVTSLLVSGSRTESVTNAWPRHVIDDSSRGSDGVRFADANSDGLPDVVTGWEQGGVIRLCLHPGNGKVKERWPSVTVGRVTDAEDAVMVDLDRDGTMDVVSSCEGKTRTVYVHWGPKDRTKILDESAWTTEALPVTEGITCWMWCVPLQLDGQNGLDLLCGSKDPGGQICWLEAPANPRELSAWKLHTIRRASWIMSLLNHDVDADGDQDVVLTDRKGKRSGCFWLENPGRGSLQRGLWKEHLIGGAGREVMFAALLPHVATGIVDVVTCAKERDTLFFRRESPHADDWKTFVLPWVGNVGRAKGINIADLNLDGKLDLIASCESAGGDKSGVFWMSYRQSFTDPQWDFHDISGTEGVKYDLVELRDLDGDGDLDVITTEENRRLGVVWYENPAK